MRVSLKPEKRCNARTAEQLLKRSVFTEKAPTVTSTVFSTLLSSFARRVAAVVFTRFTFARANSQISAGLEVPLRLLALFRLFYFACADALRPSSLQYLRSVASLAVYQVYGNFMIKLFNRIRNVWGMLITHYRHPYQRIIWSAADVNAQQSTVIQQQVARRILIRQSTLNRDSD